VVETAHDIADPRIRRTRRLLQQALEKLLEAKDFDKISIQDIAEEATVNRVTFYDHYTDKFALLQCVVGSRFQELMTQRCVQFDGTCGSQLKALVAGVCDYLAAMPGIDAERQANMAPHLEAAVKGVVRRMILEGLRKHAPASTISPEMVATTLSWAIYGAAQEWVRTPQRCDAAEIVDAIARLVAPIFQQVHAQ